MRYVDALIYEESCLVLLFDSQTRQFLGSTSFVDWDDIEKALKKHKEVTGNVIVSRTFFAPKSKKRKKIKDRIRSFIADVCNSVRSLGDELKTELGRQSWH